MQTAEEAEKLRKFRKEQLGIDEKVQANDMEQNQDFLTSGNVKVAFSEFRIAQQSFLHS